MRHLKIGRKLNRNSSHRLSMFRNMAISLLDKEIIKTTLAKAKELRRIVEPLITLSKINTIFNRRLVFSRIRNNNIVSKLFNNFGLRFEKKNGGYISILKCGFRNGDSAPLVYVRIVNKFSIQSTDDKC